MPATTGSTFCARTPRSIRCTRCCAIANCSSWSGCSGRPRICWRPARSITKPTPPFAGMCFVVFLALVLRKELEDRLSAAQLKPEWNQLLADLDRLQEVEAEQDGKRFILRTPVTGVTGKLFQAIGVALPPNIREADPARSAA